MRRFFALILMVPLFLAGCIGQSQAAIVPTPISVSASLPAPVSTSQPVQAQATNCSSPVSLTPSVTEGPFYKAGSPERSSLLETGMQGTQLTLSGYVVTTDCQPLSNVLLDFWQADSQGQYDNAGYLLRGHLFTDAMGHYQLVTIIPGLYPGRTEHIHVKVQAPNGPIMTTQLFFPSVAFNHSDPIFDPRLLLPTQSGDNGVTATFNFVISTK